MCVGLCYWKANFTLSNTEVSGEKIAGRQKQSASFTTIWTVIHWIVDNCEGLTFPPCISELRWYPLFLSLLMNCKVCCRLTWIELPHHFLLLLGPECCHLKYASWFCSKQSGLLEQTVFTRVTMTAWNPLGYIDQAGVCCAGLKSKNIIWPSGQREHNLCDMMWSFDTEWLLW